MRRLLQLPLALLAQLTLRRYAPRVVGVTGSVGKTTTRLAVAHVLATRFRVGSPARNLNNEIGLPLAVLGEPDSGYRNPLAWLGILARALWQLVRLNPSYPEVLVLEYGVDHPGDMACLTRIAKPEVAVLTAIQPTHLQFMGTLEAVAREKGELVAALPSEGTAVLNIDDELVLRSLTRTKARAVTFGFTPRAAVRAEGVQPAVAEDGRAFGVSFKLALQGSSVPLTVPGVVGEPPVRALLAAAAVAQLFGLSTMEIARALPHVPFPPGRLVLLPGVRGTTVVDDTYTPSPASLSAALAAVRSLPLPPGARRWAVLGSMLELGQKSAEYHRAAGREVASLGYTRLVAVGKEAGEVAAAARSTGGVELTVWEVPNAAAAAERLLRELAPGDLVLVKGSRGVRLEQVVHAITAEPARASELLVPRHA